jgi:hypothetical protein
MKRSWAILAALLVAAPSVHAAPDPLAFRTGDVFEIVKESEGAQTADGGSTSSSFDRDTITERVVRTSDAGLELEYDLAKSVTAEDRARQWQFPARILKPTNGPLQLLNRPELEARATAWLKAAGLTTAACGQWYFTWNAFQIDCDPQSVVKTIEGFDPGPDGLSDGAPYKAAEALAPAPLKRKAGAKGGDAFTVELAVDPDAVRRADADSDVVLGQIMRKPVTPEAALRARSAEEVSGTISITFETDRAGHVQRRTTVTVLKVKGPDGRVETRTVRETLQRRRVSGPAAA